MENMKIFIANEWITGNCERIEVPDEITKLYLKNILKSKRWDFVENLVQRGYVIITNPCDIDEDTICFTLDITNGIKSNIDKINEKREFDKRIMANGGKHFHFPRTLRIIDYFNTPFFPAVFKNELRNGGVDKFLIESPRQLATIRDFFCISYGDRRFVQEWNYVTCQEVIDTPSQYDTYIRVLASGSGEVLGSTFRYSRGMPNSFSLNGLFERVFLRPESKFFINAPKMFNYYAGGKSISFERPIIDEEAKKVLALHGLNAEDLKIPDEILSVVKNMMTRCNRDLGIICGFDFILNKKDGLWYYLECQAQPAIDEWLIAKGYDLPKQYDFDNFINEIDKENQIRLEALEQTVEYRKKTNKQM